VIKPPEIGRKGGIPQAACIGKRKKVESGERKVVRRRWNGYGTLAANRMTERITWERIIDQYQALFKGLLSTSWARLGSTVTYGCSENRFPGVQFH
jgi:hypothetical protein